MSHIANKIDAEDKSLGELLYSKRFRIDVFQREYKWGKKQMEDLINDVTGSFFKCYDPFGEVSNYNDYDCYYMGPVVFCQTNKDTSIIDGQQRLTSFTLLLIYLNSLAKHLQLPEDELRNLNDYVFVSKGGAKTLVLNIENRRDVMYGLMDSGKQAEMLSHVDRYEQSNRNILMRYADIREMFPTALKDRKALQTFIDWILDKVIFVQISAYSMDNAYTIFETMNDRGLNLSPTEILKGFLLSKIIDGSEGNYEKADEANEFWNACVSSLRKTLGYDNSDLDFFKAWFRAKYAETKRQTKAGAENEDFELIGTQFHSWVKNNTSRMGLRSNEDFYYFIKSDFEFYSKLYQRIFLLKQNLTEGFEYIYNDSFFTIADSLYYPLILSAISKIDDNETTDRKIRAIGRFIECYSNIRMLQNKSISQPVVRNNIYDLVKVIRNIDVSVLEDELRNELRKLSAPSDLTHLKVYNGPYIKYLMARIMQEIYKDEGLHSIEDFLPSRRKNAYVLCVIQDDDTYDTIDGVEFYEIANFVLIRRCHLESFRALRTIGDKVTFIRENGYTPEVHDDADCIEKFFTTRRNIFAKVIEKLFFQNEL